MSELQRFGLQWKSETDFIPTPMEDGYWTPWHLADQKLLHEKSEREKTESLAVSLSDEVTLLKRQMAQMQSRINDLVKAGEAMHTAVRTNPNISELQDDQLDDAVESWQETDRSLETFIEVDACAEAEEVRAFLKAKVLAHSEKRKACQDKGDKRAASFYEGCMKTAEQLSWDIPRLVEDLMQRANEKAQSAKPIITILDPESENYGNKFRVSNEDWMRFNLLPEGTKLYFHPEDQKASFQNRVAPWMQACFGPEISADRNQRNERYLEESLELVQSLGYQREQAYRMVDYVFDRPIGETTQEVGGVRVTLAALCLAAGIDEDECAEKELARIWVKIPEIREKQKEKP